MGIAGAPPETAARPRVAPKFLAVGDEKLWVRGVTYGPFRPVDGCEYGSVSGVIRDFAHIGGAARRLLDDRRCARAIEARVRAGVRAGAGHPGVLCYAVGNARGGSP